ncbi:MAG: tetratricopeptide repeat protein [Gammaproteobacteria bacterium]|nr:tetratricopeptide repeat protein [Gammaproteobacteria bacterium]
MALNEYETEEQQVEALKKWWKENGTSLIVGLFVGVSALFGWRYYTEQNNAHAVYASDLYMQVMQSAAIQTVDDKTIDIHNQLINEFSDTPYAALASLALAKTEYEKDNVDGAVAQLELAIKHANDDITKQIASLRLVSIYLEQKKYDEAMSYLNMKHDAAYDAQYEELKGDVYSAKGDNAQARMAYDNAINLQGVAASKWLMLKRQNLGQQNQDSAENISAVDLQTNNVNL